jgi:hypothetical protein
MSLALLGNPPQAAKLPHGERSERPPGGRGSILRTYGNHFRNYHRSHRWCYRQVPHARKGSRWLDYHDLNRFSWLVYRHLSGTSSWSVSRRRACWLHRIDHWRDDPPFPLPAFRPTTRVKRHLLSMTKAGRCGLIDSFAFRRASLKRPYTAELQQTFSPLFRLVPRCRKLYQQQQIQTEYGT